MTEPARKPKAVYDPSRFHEVATVNEAVALILTPEAGMTSNQRWQDEAPYLMELMEKHITKNSVVVDYGCGIGRLSKPLIEKLHCFVMGVDISSNMRALADSCVDSDHFMSLHPEMMAFLEPESAHAVIAVWTLQHCRDPKEDIARIKRVLKPDGLLFVVNNVHRAVPISGGDWFNDGIKIPEMLEKEFTLVEKDQLDQKVAPGWLKEQTFWAVYRK